jgi:hypothetical protein
MKKMLALVALSVGFSIANATPGAQYSYQWSVSPAVCPMPHTQMLVKCPSRYEVTTATTSCKKFIPVDLCASY